LKPIHILTSDPTAGVICAELSRLGQTATWGATASPAAKYVIAPHAPEGTAQADRITADEILRAVRNAHDSDADSLRTSAFAVRVNRRPAPPQTEPRGREMLITLRDGTRMHAVPVGTPGGHRLSDLVAPSTGRPIVLHVMPWDLTVGGGQRMLDAWCANEGERWQVHIVTLGVAPALWEFRGARITQLRQPREVADFCAALRPDVVVTHNCDHPSVHGTAAFPQVWYAHGEKILNGQRPAWAVPTAYIANYPQTPEPSWNGVRAYVSRLGVDLDRFHPGAQCGHATPEPVVGIVGRLSPEKIPDEFLDVLAAWDHGPWRVRFIGAGIVTHYHVHVRQKLAHLPWVEFTGDIAPENMPDAYRALDALLVPSRTETGSYVIAEAMACGLPVVSRDIPGPRFTAGDHGLFAATDAGLLAAVRTLDDATARERLATESCAWARDNLDTRRHSRRCTAIYAAAAPPRVSILMPVWNTPAEYLREAVQSVMDQTEPLWELVIVDDGSDDQRTIDEMALLAGADPRIRIYRLGHAGISKAMNYGLHVCRSDLVARMDSDDAMYPERLALQLAYMARHPDVAVLGAQIAMDATGSNTNHAPVITLDTLNSRDWLLNHPAVMYRRHVVERLGGYDETMQATEDLDLWIRLLKAGEVIHNLPDVLVRYRSHGGQITRHHDVLAIAVRLRDKYGLPQLYADAPAVFDRIYTEGLWGARGSSGVGSTPEATAHLQGALPDLLASHGIRSVIDAGCGTADWLERALAGRIERYLGLDVSRFVADMRTAQDHPEGWTYRRHDLAARPVADRADMVIARDVLVHLPMSKGVDLIRHAAESARWLLAAHWPGKPNEDIAVGGWRPLDLEALPYGLPQPVAMIPEVNEGKYLALFDLGQWQAHG
jgi:glycosyltransferase involved in cell wall biosynthesis/SAM-dependent methyltransferase